MVQPATPTLPTILVVFGATGDLMRRKLVPALYHLHFRRLLPPMFRVIGFSRRDWTDGQFRDLVASARPKVAVLSEPARRQFLELFTFHSGLLDRRESYDQLAVRLGIQDKEWQTCSNKLFHLAVPPELYPTILTQLAASGLTRPCSPEEGFSRVLVEKPFGKDLATAQELDALLARLFKEEQIYRIDHYLGKETVRNVLAFRFSNAFFEPAWNQEVIERITIRLLESGGIGERGSYYDGVGALRDVGQNHLLQLLAIFTMDNPGSFTAEAIRRQRQAVLAALKIMTPAEVASHTIRGQYQGYRQEPNVAPGSTTETYFKIKAHLDLPRWQNVPIYLESGKRMGEDKAGVSVTFRHLRPCLCPPGRHYRNVLRYHIQPREGIAASFWVKKPGPAMVLEERDFAFDYHGAFAHSEFLDAYEKLLLDAINGDQTLFVSTGEILPSWRFTDPIVRTWQRGAPPLREYPPHDRAVEHQPLPVDLGREGPLRLARSKAIGFIGLGKMGRSLVQRLSERGWQVTAYNRTREKLAEVAPFGVAGVTSLAELAERLQPPRVVWLMVSAGSAVDDLLFGPDGLAQFLLRGDIVIDGGNSFYEDSVRRAKRLSRRGVHFLDVGVSGGPYGARYGACLMIGGEPKVFRELEVLFDDVATIGGYAYLGPVGAGHFAKMVHNGIEYGMMQALAEGFATLRKSRFTLDLAQVADLYNHGSVIASRLVGWLRSAYKTYGEELSGVSGSVAHTGEGEWTVKTARKLKVPVPIIKGSFDFRVKSTKAPSYMGKILSVLRNQFGGHDIGKSKARPEQGRRGKMSPFGRSPVGRKSEKLLGKRRK